MYTHTNTAGPAPCSRSSGSGRASPPARNSYDI